MVRQQVSLLAHSSWDCKFFWLSPSHGGCYARTERSNLFWSHWSNQWLKSELLAISAEHGIRSGLLPGPHKDPFDRMLIAQSQAQHTPIISDEAVFESYGVRRVW